MSGLNRAGRPSRVADRVRPTTTRTARRTSDGGRRDQQSSRRSNPDVVAALRAQRIELPSWAFGNSGTRFKVFAQKGVPRDPYEKVADAAQVHAFTGVAPTVALHIPWDKVDDYADLARHAADAGVSLGHDQLEHLPGRRLHARQRLPSRCARPPQGARPPPRLHRHHGRDRLARPQAVVRRRDELPRPGRHPRAPGSAGRGARGGPRAARAGPADAARVQVLRAVVLHDGRAGLGHRLHPVRRRRAQGEGRRRHRPPRAGHQHRVHRRLAPPGRSARRLRLQLAVLRRRRPDGRLGRPVPAVPDHARGRAGRRPER